MAGYNIIKTFAADVKTLAAISFRPISVRDGVVRETRVRVNLRGPNCT